MYKGQFYYWVVGTDVPVPQYDGRRHAFAWREEAIGEQAEVVYCPAAVPSDRRDIPSIRENLEGAWPRSGKALSANEVLVQIAHEEDGAIWVLRVDFEECR